MTEAEFRRLVLALPGVEEGVSWNEPSYKLSGKFFTRVRAEDVSAVIQDVGQDEREALIASAPDVFHVTDHYRSYAMVLARLGPATPEALCGLLERSWRKRAPRSARRSPRR